jgi:hypothetical protein
MMSSWRITMIRVSAVAMFIFSGCSSETEKVTVATKVRWTCGQYLDYLENPRDRQRLVEWVDRSIFSQSFQDIDFKGGHYSGPGRRGATFRLDTTRLKRPAWMPTSYEVRAVGPSEADINTVFIGGGRFQGVVVIRADWESSFDPMYLNRRDILARAGRVGLVCYLE